MNPCLPAASAVLLAILAGPSRAQAEIRDAVLDETASADLSVRLAAGDIWRQEVGFESVVTGVDGQDSFWTFDYRLRLRCVEAVPGGYSVAGQFLTWHLRLRQGDCSYEWDDGRYLYLGDQEGQEEGAREACNDLLAAWSAGLREADLRFVLGEDGRVSDLSGLGALHRKVASTLGQIDLLPPEFLLYFGEGGLARADGALALALAVPRPVERVEPGATWFEGSSVSGLAEDAIQVQRNFQFTGVGRERRFRFADIAIDPQYRLLDDQGRWTVVETAAGATEDAGCERVRILVDNGLLFEMMAELRYELPCGQVARFRLRSQLGD